MGLDRESRWVLSPKYCHQISDIYVIDPIEDTAMFALKFECPVYDRSFLDVGRTGDKGTLYNWSDYDVTLTIVRCIPVGVTYIQGMSMTEERQTNFV